LLYVNLTASENNARQNVSPSIEFSTVPDGWVKIPDDLEETARGYLPYLALTLNDDGNVMAVSEADHETPQEDIVATVSIDETVRNTDATVSLMSFAMNDIISKNATLTSQNATLTSDLETANTEISTLKSNVSDMQSTIETMQQAISSLQT